ncbi:Serine/threonine-protein kinase BUD32 [Papiliotrema laurentii]|uniref:EKC/KEOPS complex subunit BUD32 n=1 Tax=Papiliotrema laurentii TaxID=5418 RepID=A0AAD9L7I8_PAPLA|nr:Serine/threonine-protein kinase BUD32 [Papiliotrema laurentii]
MASASQYLLQSGSLIKQGAEAKVYVLDHFYPEPTTFTPPSYTLSSASSSQPGPSVILKYRFPKTYRHPTLDATLTRTRLNFEARALARCTRGGVTVPKVLWVDENAGVLGMERIEGWSIREVLGGGAEGEAQEEDETERDSEAPSNDQVQEAEGAEYSEGMEALEKAGVDKKGLMSAIGAALARLHATNIIHGDLTTSNMMARLTPHHPSEPFEIVLIDFGLSSTAQFPEHFAVDLYVLERAFASTHPQSEALYAGVLEAYAKGLGDKKWKPIEAKLKEVRLRGRKRDMTG